MSRCARAIAMIVATAVITLPAMIDCCAVTCEAAHSAGASTQAPACHHSSSTAARMVRPPEPCGHDHTGVVATLSASSAPFTRALLSDLAVPAILAPAATAAHRYRPAISPVPRSLASEGSSHLRI